MSDSTSGPPTPAATPDDAPAAKSMSMDDFDTLNRVVSQALGICDAVQASSDISEQHASALWAAVDLLQLGRGILQRYTLASGHHG